MKLNLQVGEQTISAEEILPLLSKYQILPQLAREIIIDRAITMIECTAEEKQIAQQQFLQQNQISQEQIPAWLKQKGITPEEFEKQLLKGIKLDKYKKNTFSHELHNYFLKRKPQLDQVVYSLIRHQDAGTIQELFFRIQENESSFVDEARKHSQGPEAQTGGLIGPVEIHTPNPKIAKILSESKPGQVWSPTKVGEWFILVRLEKYIAAQFDQSMQQRLIDELFQTWLREQIQQTVTLVPAETVTNSSLEI
jgi:parvulin-like peptidyl-prolyl isomerase